MFTGIISDTAKVVRSTKVKDGLKITFQRPKSWDDLKNGDSIATDGVCLTVASLSGKDTYDCILMPETLAKTSFGSGLPRLVNLERPMQISDRFGGHFVQGHVDCVGTVSNINTGDGHRLYIKYPNDFRDLVVQKGSITLNGVSLTVAEDNDAELAVALIPFTLEHTNLGGLKLGDSVNMEFDVLGKYVKNLLEKR